MPLQRVRQDHYDGCFVACVAMLLGVSYLDAFNIVHPGRMTNELGYEYFSVLRAGIEHKDVPAAVFEILNKLNLKPKKARVQDIRRLRRLAVVLIRWKCSPTLMHAVVFDPKSKQLLDPSSKYPDMKSLSEQMEAAFYVDVAA